VSLTKASLCEMIKQDLGLSRREAKELVECFFEEIRSNLESGDSVKLSGFGHFELREKTPRPGRNPMTGEEVEVSARRVTTFKAGVHLKKAISKYSG
jgi:integration host factor subunit alpha